MTRYLTSVFLSCICCALFSQATAQEASKSGQSPPENPPQILVASSIDASGQLVLVRYKTIFIGFSGESYNNRSTTSVSLKDVRILTADGNEISMDTARQRLRERDTPILATSYKRPLPKFYASMFTPSTLHFAFPGRAPEWRQIQEPGRPVGK